MVGRTLKRSLALPLQGIRRSRAKQALVQLGAHESTTVRAIAQALLESVTDTMSDAERELIAAIERRRASLLRSDAEIAVVDYGAGNPGAKRTPAEMQAGVAFTVAVSRVSRASKPPFWAKVLFKLIRKLGPASCLELGSCVGISAAYQALALRLNGDGQLVTLEGSPEVARIAATTLADLGLRNASVVTGPFHHTLTQVLETAAPVDFFFNDGHHDHDAVLRYFETAAPHLAADAVVVIDDISWSPGMRRAWSLIEADARVRTSLDLQTVGIAVVSRAARPKERFRIPM